MRYLLVLCVVWWLFSCEYTIYQPSERLETVIDTTFTEKPDAGLPHEVEQEILSEEVPREVLIEPKEDDTEQTNTCFETLPRQHLYLATRIQDQKKSLYIVGIHETKESFLLIVNFREEAEFLGRRHKTAEKEDTNILLFALDKRGVLLWSKHLKAKGMLAANDSLAHEDGSFWIGGLYNHDWEVDGVKMINAPRLTKQPTAQAFVLHFDKQARLLWGKSFEQVDESASTTRQIFLNEQKKINILREVFLKDYTSKVFWDSISAQGQVEETKEIRQKRGWTLGFDITPEARGTLNQFIVLGQSQEGFRDLFLHQTSSGVLLQVLQEPVQVGSYTISAVDRKTWQEVWNRKIQPKSPNSISTVEITSNSASTTVAVVHQGSIQVGEHLFDHEPYESNLLGSGLEIVSFYNFSLRDGSLLWARHWLALQYGVTSLKQQEDGSLWVWGTTTGIYDIYDQTGYDFRAKKDLWGGPSYLVRIAPKKKLVKLSTSSYGVFTFANSKEIHRFVPKHQPHPFSLVYAEQPCFQIGQYQGYLRDAPEKNDNPFPIREHLIFFFQPPFLP